MTCRFEKSIPLVISDLDGTLLNEQHLLTPEVKQQINHLVQNRQLLFTYATSRDYVDFRKAVHGVLLDAPIILCNGAILVNPLTGQIIKGFYFDLPDLAQILATLSKYDLEIKIVCAEDNYLQRYAFTTNHSTYATKNIVSISTINHSTLINQLFAKLKEALGEKVTINLYSNPYQENHAILDLTPKTATKGQAIKALREISDVSYYIIGFGNDYNDQTLLSESDYAVAVGRCPEELLTVADRQIEYTGGASVLTVVEDILQIKG